MTLHRFALGSCLADDIETVVMHQAQHTASALQCVRSHTQFPLIVQAWLGSWSGSCHVVVHLQGGLCVCTEVIVGLRIVCLLNLFAAAGP